METIVCIALRLSRLSWLLNSMGNPGGGGACNDQSLGFPRRVDDPESQTQTNQLTRLPAPSVGLCRPAFPPSSSWPMIMTMQWLTGSGKAAANLAGRNGDHVVSGLSGRDRGERRDRGRKKQTGKHKHKQRADQKSPFNR